MDIRLSAGAHSYVHVLSSTCTVRVKMAVDASSVLDTGDREVKKREVLENISNLELRSSILMFLFFPLGHCHTCLTSGYWHCNGIKAAICTQRDRSYILLFVPYTTMRQILTLKAKQNVCIIAKLHMTCHNRVGPHPPPSKI